MPITSTETSSLWEEGSAPGSVKQSNLSSIDSKGYNSMAQGTSTKTFGYSSHAEGNGSKAVGACSHAEGNGTIAGKLGIKCLNLVNWLITVESTYGDVSSQYSNGDVIYLDDTNFDGNFGVTTKVINYSSWNGTNTLIQLNILGGIYVSPDTFNGLLAYNTTVITPGNTNDMPVGGNNNHSEGNQTKALGDDCHAEGLNTIAIGNASHVEGINNKATGGASHSEGSDNNAIGYASHAEGMNTIAVDYACHAEGQQTTASSGGSHAEGLHTISSGGGSHSEGLYTTASSAGSHAGGESAVAFRRSEWARSNSARGQYGVASGSGFSIDNTPFILYLNESSLDNFSIPNNTAYRILLEFVVMDYNSGDVIEFSGLTLIKNLLGTTSLVGTSTFTSSKGDPSLSAVYIQVAADNVNSCLKIQCKGIDAKRLNWFCKISYTAVNNLVL